MLKQQVSDRLEAFVGELIAEGEAVCQKPLISDSRGPASFVVYVDPESFSRWAAKCRHLAAMLGSQAAPWNNVLSPSKQANHLYVAKQMLGTLRAVHDTLKAGLLVRVEQLVMAEAFRNLLEQAEYLAQETYHIAAGVLGRAVLEEHLRKWCNNAACSPTKQRPTISDFNMALYAAKHIDKLTMKHVDAMAAIGNDAAHVKADLQESDVERLLRDVREFVTRHPG